MMTRTEARSIIGKTTRYTSGMAKALGMMSWLNTADEWRRLRALKSLGFKVRYTAAEMARWETEARGKEGGP